MSGLEETHGNPTAVWERISHFYQATRKPVHMAVAYTADAAAASITLTGLLKAFLIPYNIHPIATYEELTAVIERTNLAQDFARMDDADPLIDELFLLVGLGAPVDLSTLFDFKGRHVVTVLDSTRPYHLANVRHEDPSRLILWGMPRIREEIASFFQRQHEVEKRHRRRRRRRQGANRRHRLRREYSGGAARDVDEADLTSNTSSDDSVDESSATDADEDDEEDDAPSQSEGRTDWMNPEEVSPYLEAQYYSSICAGRSCAVEAHEVAALLNRSKEATLWHAAVGVCDLFNRRLIDYGSYLVEMRPLQDAVTLQRSVRRGALVEVTDAEANRYRRLTTNAMQLSNREEEQLHLLRHTTLWDAIWLHPVTASVLGLHHPEDGEGFLRQLLARCGVSVKVARRPWREVPVEDKKEALRLVQAELKHIIDRKGSFLSHPNAVGCVSRTIGYSTEVSTFDACTLFDALVAASPTLELYQVPAELDEAAAAAVLRQRLQQFHRAQFWKAHTIIDIDPSEKSFAAAVQESVSLQFSIANATSALMQPGMLLSTAGLHYTVPNDPTKTTSAMESFRTVYRLHALASRLLLTLTVERGLGRYTRMVRPLLLSSAMLKPRQDSLTANSLFNSPLAVSANGGSGGSTLQELPQSSSHLSVSNDDGQYLVVLTQLGASGPGLVPLAPVGRLQECIQDRDEFAQPPQQLYVERNVVVVGGRTSAVHLAEVMYLRCLSASWNPQREYMNRVAVDQECQGSDPGSEAGAEVREVGTDAVLTV